MRPFYEVGELQIKTDSHEVLGIGTDFEQVLAGAEAHIFNENRSFIEVYTVNTIQDFIHLRLTEPFKGPSGTYRFWIDNTVSNDIIESARKNEEQRQKCKMVDRERVKTLAAGFIYGGNTYDLDGNSLLNITATMAAIAGGIKLPKDFAWRTKDNTMVPMNAKTFAGLAAAAFDHMNSIYQASFKLKDAILEDK